MQIYRIARIDRTSASKFTLSAGRLHSGDVLLSLTVAVPAHASASASHISVDSAFFCGANLKADGKEGVAASAATTTTTT